MISFKEERDKYFEKFFSRKILIPILAISLFFLFKTNIETIWGKIIIDTILSKLERNNFSDYFFIFLNLIIVLFFTKKFLEKYFISTKTIFGLIVISSVYLFCYRINTIPNFYWYNFNLYPLNNFYYADTIVVYTFGALSVYAKNRFTSSASNNIQNSYSDEPIKNTNDDKLGRIELAEIIVRAIKNSSSVTSVGFGIVGEWGIGKTSLMNLVKIYLPKKDFEIIDFSPWIGFSRNDIVKDFFEVIGKRLNKYSPELQELFNDYSLKLIENNDYEIVKYFKSFINKVSSNDYNDKAKDIDTLLDKIGKKIVIVIDDIDRVEPEIVLSVIQLVRSSANFKNFVFIVGYDKGYVTNAIKTIIPHNSEKFLEKIFLQEFLLPDISSDILRAFVKNELVKIFPAKTDEIENSLFGEKYKSNPFDTKVLNNLRDYKRFLNYFIESYSMGNIKDEVSFIDLFYVEMIRVKYPMVYRLLEASLYNFINIKSENEYISNSTQSLKLIKKNENPGYLIEEELNENLSKYLISKSDVSIIIDLLEYLFYMDQVTSFRRPKPSNLSIVHSKNYHKYFIKRLKPTDFSNSDFITYYKKDFSELSVKAKEWIEQGKKRLLIERIQEININEIESKKEYEKLIDLIFLIGRSNTPTSDFFSWGYDVDDFRNRLMISKKKKVEFFGDDESYKIFVKNKFEEAPYPFLFESDFLNKMQDVYDESYFVLNKNELKQLILHYFEEYLNANDFITDNVWTIYNDCRETVFVSLGNSTYEKKDKQNVDAIGLLKKFIDEKDLIGFLNNIIDYGFNHPTNEKMRGIHNIVSELYGSNEEFKKYLEGIEQNPLEAKDILGLIEELKVKGSKHVKYTFQYLPNENPRNLI